jgi:hypothetical protein
VILGEQGQGCRVRGRQWCHVTNPGTQALETSTRVQVGVYCPAVKLILAPPPNPRSLANHISTHHHHAPVKALPDEIDDWEETERGGRRGDCHLPGLPWRLEKQPLPWPYSFLLSHWCSGSHLRSNVTYGRSGLFEEPQEPGAPCLPPRFFPSQGWICHPPPPRLPTCYLKCYPKRVAAHRLRATLAWGIWIYPTTIPTSALSCVRC